MWRRGRFAGAVCAAWLAAGALLLPGRAAADEVSVAAAADLQSVMPKLAARFERAAGHRLMVTYGSSGNFFSQIQNGAPFDVFCSADIEYPRQLVAGGFVEPGSLVEYATGRIVLWARKSRPLDVSRGLGALVDQGVRRIAIANPDHAPYGRAAVAALKHAGVYDQVRTKLIRGENVAQAAQFVESGNADAGIIALSLAQAPALKATGVFYEIPAVFHQPLAQAAVVITASRRKDAARAFLAFLATPESVGLLQAYGFTVPPRKGRPD